MYLCTRGINVGLSLPFWYLIMVFLPQCGILCFFILVIGDQCQVIYVTAIRHKWGFFLFFFHLLILWGSLIFKTLQLINVVSCGAVNLRDQLNLVFIYILGISIFPFSKMYFGTLMTLRCFLFFMLCRVELLTFVIC